VYKIKIIIRKATEKPKSNRKTEKQSENRKVTSVGKKKCMMEKILKENVLSLEWKRERMMDRERSRVVKLTMMKWQA